MNERTNERTTTRDDDGTVINAFISKIQLGSFPKPSQVGFMIRVSIASMRANLCSISLNRSAASSSRPPPPPPPPLPDPSDPSLSLCGRVGVTCVSHGADPPSPAASLSFLF